MTRALVGSITSLILLAGTAQADSGGLGKVQMTGKGEPRPEVDAARAWLAGN